MMGVDGLIHQPKKERQFYLKLKFLWKLILKYKLQSKQLEKI
jgi:hypothetical protein